MWLGAPPKDVFERQLDVYRSYSPESALQHWRGTGFICHDDPAALADEVATGAAACGATALNLRVHVPGVSPDAPRNRSPRWAPRSCRCCAAGWPDQTPPDPIAAPDATKPRPRCNGRGFVGPGISAR